MEFVEGNSVYYDLVLTGCLHRLSMGYGRICKVNPLREAN